MQRISLVILAAALTLTGCLSTEGASMLATTSVEPTTPVDASEAAAPADGSNATLPDDRGDSSALKETRRTEAGVGGMEHKHDYWGGLEQVVLLDKVIDVGCPPCMPEGPGSSAKSIAYVKLGALPAGEGEALVYEGADRVDVTLGAPQLLFRHLPTAHPAPPKLTLQYRSAADAEWRLPIDVRYGETISIEVEPQMTDMPHSTHSLWVFRLVADRAEASFGVPMNVVVHRGRDVVDWPGHPDFYAETNTRIVTQRHVTTHMGGYENILLYGSEGTWAQPEKLISWATKEIHIFANVTSIRNAANLQPTSYFLEAHNATIIGPEITFGSRHRDIDGNDDLLSYHFALKVDDVGMDGPYQPASRWGFRLMAMFGDVDGVIGACPGCFAYDVEYDLTILALDHETGVAQAMERS